MDTGTFTLSQGAGHKLETAINRAGGGIEDIEWLSAGDNFKTFIAWRKGDSLQTFSEFLAKHRRIVVDYNQTLLQMIVTGNYDDCRHGDIAAVAFQLTDQGVAEYEYKLVHINEGIYSDPAKQRIEKDGWQVAQIEHLLAFGSKHPDEQRKYPIIALGSVAKTGISCVVAGLGGGGANRSFRLNRWNSLWTRDCRFLVIRKVSAV